MSQSQGSQAHSRWMFAALWLLAALLIAGSSRAPNETVRVLDGRGETAMEPEGTWTVPVLSWPAMDRMASWPFWLYVLLGSLLLAIVGRQMLARDTPPALVFVALVGLGLLARPEHFTLAAMLFIIAFVLHANWSPFRKLLALALCLGLSLLVTIEFGFVALIALSFFAPEFWKSSSNKMRGLSLAALVVFAVLIWRDLGLKTLLLRPVSWIGEARPDSIFSSGFPAFSAGADWRAPFLLLVFFVFCWLMIFWRAEAGLRYLLPVAFLTLVGFGQAESLWISGLALALVFRVPMRSEISPRIGYAVLAVALVFGALRFLPRFGTYLDVALGEGTPALVEPALWDIEGRVMLLDLSQSVDWQHARMREDFQLLMDDRWGVFQDEYARYAAACRDMREILADSYLREDQKWGGYKAWLNEWSPTLLVANSSNLWDIRRLSLSPHWRVMGIDARRTIFGYAKDQKNYRQSAKAFGMMTQLEWPPLASPPWPENVIAASTPGELLKVSRVLNALRFPYAALRLLPDQETPEVLQHRAWCHLEIAHRVYRHSGQGSLLDQFRGVHGLRQRLTEEGHDPEDILLGLSSLEGLGLGPLARQLAEEWTKTGAADSLSAEERERLAAIGSQMNGQKDSVEANPNSSEAQEAKIRTALLEGDREAAEKELENLDQPESKYYALIASSWNRSSAELMNELSALLKDPDFPEHRRGEALFYLGCLALEAGDSGAAVSAFRESAQVEPHSPFHALRQMYRLQMGDR